MKGQQQNLRDPRNFPTNWEPQNDEKINIDAGEGPLLETIIFGIHLLNFQGGIS